MAGEIVEELRKTGVDVEATLARFMGNASLYEKFLVKFINDPSYNELKEGLDAKNYDVIEKSAHTLKGVSGNLGMMKLFNMSSNIVNKVRAGDHEGLDEMFSGIAEEYEKICNVIKQGM